MKQKFPIEKALKILSKERKKWDAPIVTLVSKRTRDPFQILVSTILSLRTKDEVTAAATERLLKRAKTPEEILKIPDDELEKIIYPVGFYRNKARTLKEISRILLEKYGGKVPNKLEELLKLPGVGRKTANLVLSEAFGKDAICVDTHVHRISNRWGIVKTKTPEETEFALMKVLPKKWWRDYNSILVAFGQTICKPVGPKCDICPIKDYCPYYQEKNKVS